MHVRMGRGGAQTVHEHTSAASATKAYAWKAATHRTMSNRLLLLGALMAAPASSLQSALAICVSLCQWAGKRNAHCI